MRRRRRAEDPLDRQDLQPVVGRGAGAVGADVAHLGRRGADVGERPLHGAGGAVRLRVGGGHVVGVAGEPVAGELGVDPRAAAQRPLERLEHQHRRSLAGDHPLAVAVERLAALRGDGAEAGEAGVGDAREGVGAAGEHEVGAAGAQHVEGVGEGVVAGRAGGRNHRVDPREAQLAGDVGGDHVAGVEREELGPHPVQPPPPGCGRRASPPPAARRRWCPSPPRPAREPRRPGRCRRPPGRAGRRRWRAARRVRAAAGSSRRT